MTSLYNVTPETQQKLRKFRLTTSRAKDAQAMIYLVDKSTFEIRQVDDEVYTDMQAIVDELPENAPRFVLLSYPMTMPDGRLSVPYVLINYLPPTCSGEVRMLFAGAKEAMRNFADVGQTYDFDDAEELEKIEDLLKSNK